MDEADLGNLWLERNLARAIGAVRSSATAGGAGRAECEDCGRPIPEGRRKAVPGCVCCVGCQAEREMGHR